MKFLLIRFSSIGDIVLTTPVIRCLKKQVATAEVHYLTKSSFRSIIEPNPYIDKAHYFETDLENVIEQLKAEDFDYVIDLHHNLRTQKIKRALAKKSFSFPKLNVEKWLLTALKIDKLPAIHIVDRYLQTVKNFGVINDRQGLDYFIPDEEKVNESDIPASHQAGYIGIVIGAALNTKKMPIHKLSALCIGINHPIILLGGKEDAATGATIAAADPHKIYNACGKFSINESADLVRRSKFIITHDTGLMHIAAALNKPMISVWGNTIPAFGMTAYYSNDKITDTRFEVTGLRCRPCSKIGYNKCPKGHFKCMENISEEEIINRTDQLLSRK